MNYDKVFKNVQNLHRINFNQIIKVNNYDDNFSLTEDYYNFNKYVGNGEYQNGSFKYGITGCCTKCDSNAILDKNEKWNKKDKIDYDNYYKDYRLKYVSHGSHTLDFLNAANLDKIDIQDLFKNESWIDIPVLFLMENPSIDYEIYNECENGKSPTNTWYWIHRKLQKPSNVNLDEYLKQGKYGEMVYSLICKYKLANAYLTNVIKCGLNGYKNGKDDYLGTVWYKDECKSKCLNEIFSKEITILTEGYDQLKIFAFGSNTYWLTKNFLQNKNFGVKIQLVQLPHPSSRLKNLYRSYTIKGIVEDMLDNNKLYEL